jgi:phosphomannomutase
MLKFLVDTIRSAVKSSITLRKQLFKALKLLSDAGNGQGALSRTRSGTILEPTLPEAIFLDPDGMFPNHIPNQ